MNDPKQVNKTFQGIEIKNNILGLFRTLLNICDRAFSRSDNYQIVYSQLDVFFHHPELSKQSKKYIT